MKTNFDITKILYSIKNINDLYYNLSVKAAYECGISKPEADILAFLNNNPALLRGLFRQVCRREAPVCPLRFGSADSS